MSEPLVVDIGHAIKQLEATPELGEMLCDLIGVPRWREIDSAPRDPDEDIDVWVVDGEYAYRVVDVIWDDGRWMYQEIPFVEWSPVEVEGRCVTHWMPKPSAPEASR